MSIKKLAKNIRTTITPSSLTQAEADAKKAELFARREKAVQDGKANPLNPAIDTARDRAIARRQPK